MFVRTLTSLRSPLSCALAWCLVSMGATVWANDLQTTLKFAPKQKDVEYDIPTADQLPKCKVEVERRGKLAGWVVLGPEGQVLRRFVDTDGDNRVDQWRYYLHGIEAYREIDTNKDDKPDQFRWVNLGGTRWGIDRNQDYRIDEWKILSAAEASREAVRAMATNDADALAALLVTEADLRQLGVAGTVAAKVMEAQSTLPARMKAVMSRSRVLSAQTKWIRFDAQSPGLIPADDGKSTAELQVYENAMAVVEPGPALVQIGEMLRVGEVWKLTQVPQPIDEKSGTIASGGILMQPLLANATPDGVAAPSPEMEQLIKTLQTLDANPPQFGAATPAQLATYNGRRADLLMKLHDLADGEEEKAQFLKQCADGLAAAVQTDAYPEGMARIVQLETSIRKSGPASALPYVLYRRLMAQNSLDMKNAEDAEKRGEIQKAFLEALAKFVEQYRTAEDAPEAMLQIAVAEEFSGKSKEAVEWYQRLAQEKTGTPSSEKAQGALRRLDMKGKPFVLTGAGLGGGSIDTRQLRGKVVLVFYWATWCQPCQADLPALRALYQQYKARGFEIVGVCLDIPYGNQKEQVAQLQKYLADNKATWPQIFEPGGLDSKPAVNYGVFSLPTMFLVDERGNVISRNSSLQELKTVLPQLFK
jgi:peroxiredoxin